ncbi:WYL domain-containing protein [Silicimonas algicola]|uniref:Putative DNA-binding transcriptional regulator YafY n=1 Tax=Silicimonas algicola TaxID=1826607 RepID=A0A316GA71_9RHOB|nr:WYL domain-containing protein [Silicimonas algicola]AZQ68030.1 WYL domain-containing protein [Silicimonas algicola]PWK57522.1 putative DNA-binding transcriptional regulator YafY [Silicimonas algicola]
MRRADRLYALIRILRDGRLHRGRELADRLGVSLRTLYRDMDALIAGGVPVEGERGIGYAMTAPITLPPLNLTLDELEALHLGLSVVGKASDPKMREAARTLGVKVDAALPEDRAAPAAGRGFALYPFAEGARGFVHMAPLRAAIRSRRKIRVTTADSDAPRVLRPLQLEYWGRIWTLTAWDEEDARFEEYRVDRLRTLDVTFETFEEEPGKSLSDHLAAG